MFLLACTAAEQVPQDSVAEAPPDAVWGPADYEAAVATGLELGFPEPARVIDLYLELVETHGSAPRCPSQPPNLTGAEALGCAADDGTWFEGVAEFVEGTDDGVTTRVLTGDYLIRTPDGEELEAGAYVGTTWSEAASDLRVVGSVRHTAAEDWLGPGASAVLEADREGVHGGLGLNGVDLDLDLDAEGDGSLAARGPDHLWYVADLSAGCGPLHLGEHPLGEVCVDLEPLLSALERGLAEPSSS